jgi:hypothetical protein
MKHRRRKRTVDSYYEKRRIDKIKEINTLGNLINEIYLKRQELVKLDITIIAKKEELRELQRISHIY